MAFLDWDAFVPGVKDLVDGNEKHGILSAEEKIRRGKIAITKLREFKEAKKSSNKELEATLKNEFTSVAFQKEYFKYFGYGFITNTNQLIPHVALMFYSFHLMVALGGYFLLFLYLRIILDYKERRLLKNVGSYDWLSGLSLWLTLLHKQVGLLQRLVASHGVIQDLMPTMAAVSRISTGAVQVTFWLFAVVFTTLLIAEVRIMVKQIGFGPKGKGGNK